GVSNDACGENAFPPESSRPAPAATEGPGWPTDLPRWPTLAHVASGPLCRSVTPRNDARPRHAEPRQPNSFLSLLHGLSQGELATRGLAEARLVSLGLDLTRYGGV